MKIFIDSDAYIGIYSFSDAHNSKTSFLIEKIKNVGYELVTSWDVVDEVTTKLSYHLNKTVANKFLQDRLISDEKIIFLTKNMTKKIEKLFLKQVSKNVSLTDCANMAIANS